MKKSIAIPVIKGLLGLLVLVGCNRKYADYQHTEEGLYVRFYDTDSTRRQPMPGDFLKLRMDYYLNDSLLYRSAEKDEYPRIRLRESDFRGDILSGLAMMHEGDSASFLVKADSTCYAMFGQIPEGWVVRPEDRMRFEIRLEQIQSAEDFEAELQAVYEGIKAQSDLDFQTYLEENQLHTKPTANGVHYWTTQAGTGGRPGTGDLVEVHYEGRFLNGVVFDSAYRKDSTFRFILGRGYVIPGWEEVVPTMQVGSRVTALIPYAMAYGDQSMGNIPPYANLVYDIELKKITDSKEVERQYQEQLLAMKTQSETDFRTYLEEHAINETPSPSGLYVIRHRQGNGIQAMAGMTARIRYEAHTLDGTLLGASDDPYQEVVIGKGAVLAGADEGLLTMREGEAVTMLLPYQLAYGSVGFGDIAPYTNIVLELELLELLPETENP